MAHYDRYTHLLIHCTREFADPLSHVDAHWLGYMCPHCGTSTYVVESFGHACPTCHCPTSRYVLCRKAAREDI